MLLEKWIVMNLLPFPRSLKRRPGSFCLPNGAVLHLDCTLSRDLVLLPVAEKIQKAAGEQGVKLELATGPTAHPRLRIKAAKSSLAPANPEGYRLEVASAGISIDYREEGGLRAAAATLCQLLREYGLRLPCLLIEDYPDFPRRGVMLDVSRGRVPSLDTLLDLADRLAQFKLNEFQLYTEHTFAYRDYQEVWQGWGPLTGEEILRLDRRCRELGIDLVPNQNSFGHLRYFLENPLLKPLAEVSEPYEGAGGSFLRYPTTLSPSNRGTLPFLRNLFDELLPHFTSQNFNVGCDETWDLGRGQSKAACERLGKGRVYFEFLKKIHREVEKRGRRMMFWGDIILNHAELIHELPDNIVALNWGYEASHPFEKETAAFKRSKVPFYVCPGTSTWMTLVGRHDNAFANLRAAAEAGMRNGAAGYLVTDWGDGGHPQPLAVSLPLYVAGASLSWCIKTYRQELLGPVLSREVYEDLTGCAAKAALGLGFAHKKLDYMAPNITPFGAVVAAPPPHLRELFCRDGLKYYARIPERNIHAAWSELRAQRKVLYDSRPQSHRGEILAAELDMAARMAEESCRYMLWQQALAAGAGAQARVMARQGIRHLRQIKDDFANYWPSRNKGTPQYCSPFLKWRTQDYRKAVLHFSPAQAKAVPSLH